MRGVVVRPQIARGFCFLEPAGGGDTVFCHVKDIDPDVPWDDTIEGRTLEFQLVSSPKGPQAKAVRGI